LKKVLKANIEFVCFLKKYREEGRKEGRTLDGRVTSWKAGVEVSNSQLEPKSRMEEQNQQVVNNMSYSVSKKNPSGYVQVFIQSIFLLLLLLLLT